jgi:hypothetical protein
LPIIATEIMESDSNVRRKPINSQPVKKSASFEPSLDALINEIDPAIMSAKLIENQRLGFKLAEDIRMLRQELLDEKQQKRLLLVTNSTLEGQLRATENRLGKLEQVIRTAEQERLELLAKYEEEVSFIVVTIKEMLFQSNFY